MADEQPESPESASASSARVPHGAVIAGVVAGQSPRVLTEAARYAELLSAPLVIVHVDVTRFVAFEDPDGYVHAAPVDAGAATAAAELAEIRDAAASALADSTAAWSVHQLIGDPALAMSHLAERIDACLLVVGTRRRGLGESIREFFTGSVAARLSHRQHRPLLVIPLDTPVPASEPLPWE